MSDSKGGGIPWTSVAVLVAFVGSTQLVPQAFNQLRPPEKERVQIGLSADMEVDARLWEDPFAALRRFEAERGERCERMRKQTTHELSCWDETVPVRRQPASLLLKLDRDEDKNLGETLLLLALVPGNPFVGAEEGRRRTRYAILAGLQAQGYVPDNAERIGLLEFEQQALVCERVEKGQPHVNGCSKEARDRARAMARDMGRNTTVPAAAENARGAASAAAATAPKFTVPFELLSKRNRHREPDTSGNLRRYEQVALLWVDESALPAPKFDALALLLQGLFEDRLHAPRAACMKSDERLPYVAVIGPSSTDALRQVLAELQESSDGFAKSAAAAAPRDVQNAACGSTEANPNLLLRGYRMLAGAEFLNAASTASNRMLDELHQQDLDAFLQQKFDRLLNERPPLKIDYRRTISTDTELIKRLVDELQLRLPRDEARRIVVVAERDSLYSQALVTELQHRLKDFKELSFEPIYYFRGLDGVTTRDLGRTDAGAAKVADPKAVLEWPESRDQLDYLRRLAQSLKLNEASAKGGPIGAIAIFGNDVHDKLLVLQALHDTFSDKVFFTTDMDARYLHPQTQGFTRNLLVASSLPLAFPAPRGKQLDLQAGTPPLRDVYQTASYLAARHAGCRSSECKAEERAAFKPVLDHPSIYEIGRKGAVALSGYAFTAQPQLPPSARMTGAALLALLMLGGLLVWPSTPALRQARALFLKRPLPHVEAMNSPAVVFVALHAVLAAFTLCSLIEFVTPNQLSFVQILLLSSLAAFAALLAVLPALTWRRAETARLGALRADSQTLLALRGEGEALLAQCGEAASLKALQQRALALHKQPEAAGFDRLHVVMLVAALLIWIAIAWPRSGAELCSTCEPVAWLQGVSAWPSHLIHLLALTVILCALDVAWADTLLRLHMDSHWLRLRRPKPHPIARTGLRNMLTAWFRQISILNWQRRPAGSHHFARLWLQYGARGGIRPRVARTLVWYILTLLVVGLLFAGLSDGQVPEVPVRGEDHRQLVRATLYALVLLLPLLVVAVADATLLAFRFIGHLNAGRTVYPRRTLRHFAEGLGSQQASAWLQCFAAEPAQRRPDSVGPHSLLDDWIDVQVVAKCTEYVSKLVIWPFMVVSLLIVARSRLFDNWALTPAIAISISVYLGWLIILAVMLKLAAEQTRRRVLASMNEDLRWLAGGLPASVALVEPFKRLIASVENNHTGAFAPMFEQPLLKALLVPLGGAGGAQLIDYLLLAR